MSTPNTTRWIGIDLLGLPLYGALTFLSSIDPQPDPNMRSCPPYSPIPCSG